MPFDKTLSERLKRHFPIRRDEQDSRYLATYDLFLKYFRDNIAVTNLNVSDAKIGVVLVYTWMQPALLKPDCWKHFPLAKKTLTRDKAGRLNVDEIEALKHFVGGSLIATSKFLHFFNPSRYAMWDTNVARAGYRYSWHQCNRSDRYIRYLDDINGLTLDEALRSRIHEAIGSASELRVKEFALFQLGLAESAPPPSDYKLDITDFPFATDNFTVDLGADEDGGD
jgi:hypothetical protein